MRRVVRWSIALACAFSTVAVSAPVEAAAPSIGCQPRGNTGGFGTYDEITGEISLTVADVRIADFICKRPVRVKYWLSVANTPNEIAAMHGWADKGRGWREPIALCERDGLAWLVSSMNEYAGWEPGPKSIASYQRWVTRYAGRNGCTVY